MSAFGDVDVVITGFGAVTGAGDDDAFRAAWLAGETSVRPFEGPAETLPPGYGAPVAFTHKELRGLPGGRGLRPGTMTANTFLAAGAVGRALKAAGIDSPETDPTAVMDRRGIYIGTYTNFPALNKHIRLTHGMANREAAQAQHYEIDDSEVMGAMKGFTGFDFLKLMNNMPTAHASIQASARGPANTFLGHSSVGLQAVGRAWDGLRVGLADQFIAGAAGPGALEGICLLRNGQGLLSDPAADPATASRPFDQGATGLVPGDAGVAIVMETAANAAARGARALARPVAWRELYVTPAQGRGSLASAAPIVAVLQGVLDDAGWTVDDVDYLAPTGSGLLALDLLEAEAIATVFGDRLHDLPVALHGGVTGFTEAAHPALGLLGALQAMSDGQLPPQVGLHSILLPLQGLRRITTAESERPDRAVVLAVAAEGTLGALAIERIA